MAANEDWLPRTLPGLFDMFKNVLDKIDTYSGTLNLSGSQVTDIKNICTEYTVAYQYVVGIKAAAKSLTEWRDLLLYGTPVGTGAPLPPAFAAFTDPGHMIIGLIVRFREFRELIVAQPNYTQAIGEDLMIATPQGEPDDPSTVKPTLDCEMAMAGNFDFSAVIGHRGDSDQCELTGCLVGSASYQHLATFTGKGTTGHWPGTGTEPVQILVRAQLKLKNQNYGIPSDPFVLTVIP